MIVRNYFCFFLIILLCFSCSKKEIEKSTINEVNLESQMIEAYKEGLEELKAGDYYGDAEAELIRYLRVYPNHKDIVYAEYLLGLCYYEQIVDEKKDLQSIIDAKKTFKSLISRYPDTEFAADAMFKINLIDEILAAKEMYIGRYYVDRKKWISAINRFRVVVDDYDTTIYVEEAIHRLVEIYYTIGIESEAKKYANLLGYNYQSSEWYEKSFSVFNKKYKKDIIKDIKKENNSILEKFKSLFS